MLYVIYYIYVWYPCLIALRHLSSNFHQGGYFIRTFKESNFDCVKNLQTDTGIQIATK